MTATFISAADATVILKMSRERVVRLVQSGKIRGRFDASEGIKNRWLVDRQDAERFAREAEA